MCRSDVAFRRPRIEHPAKSTGASGPSSRMRRIPSNCSRHFGCGWNTGLGGDFGLALLAAGFLASAAAAALVLVVVVFFFFAVSLPPSSAVLLLLLLRRLRTGVAGGSFSLPPAVDIDRQRPCCCAKGGRGPRMLRRRTLGPLGKRTHERQGVAGRITARSSPSTRDGAVAADGVMSLVGCKRC